MYSDSVRSGAGECNWGWYCCCAVSCWRCAHACRTLLGPVVRHGSNNKVNSNQRSSMLRQRKVASRETKEGARHTYWVGRNQGTRARAKGSGKGQAETKIG
jgi:hypothetical protein